MIMSDMEKQKSMVREIILKKYNPEQYEAEQAQKKQETAELLAFVDGVLAEHNRKKAEEAQNKEDNILFKSDSTSPTGFSPTEKAELKKSIKKLFKR